MSFEILLPFENVMNRCALVNTSDAMRNETQLLIQNVVDMNHFSACAIFLAKLLVSQYSHLVNDFHRLWWLYCNLIECKPQRYVYLIELQHLVQLQHLI